MKNKVDINFESLLNDESFIEKVRKGGSGARKYIDNLVKKNPGKKEEILLASQFLITTNTDRKRLKGIETSDMWESIRQKQTRKKQVGFGQSRNILRFVWKVAAVAVIILGFGYYFYSQHTTSNSFKRMAQNTKVPTDEALIILSDGTEHELKNNESSISYDPEGEDILITEPDRQSEKIKNTKNAREEILNQIIVPFGRRHSVTLSDGTIVQLNSGSKLVFPASFKGNLRKVYLSGEAFFQVAKNHGNPFIVSTNHIKINVTGTKFNVSAYEDESVSSTVLLEGKVEVCRGNKLFDNLKINLKPGQGCFYSSNTDESVVEEVDVLNYISWQYGWFQFDDQPLKNIVKRVEKYYNKEIKIENEKLGNTIISGKLVLSDEFENVIKYLAKTVECGYLITNNGVYILN